MYPAGYSPYFQQAGSELEQNCRTEITRDLLPVTWCATAGLSDLRINQIVGVKHMDNNTHHDHYN